MLNNLYIQNEYLTEFEAQVINSSEKKDKNGQPVYEVILNQTAFYPEKGGQPCDLGTIGDAKVTYVYEDGETIVHVIDKPLEVSSESLKCKIDWDRRFENMQQHAGQHLLAAAFLNILKGYTVSMHIGSAVNTIDVELQNVSEDDVLKVQELANKIIYENRQIKKFVVNAEEVKSLPLRKQPKVTTDIRIVEIADFDMSPCGGTHVNSTGEIGIIKILKVENYKKMTRVEFVCGIRALSDYNAKSEILSSLGRQFSSTQDNLLNTIEKFDNDKKELENKIKGLTSKLLDYEISEIAQRAKKVNCNTIIKTFDSYTMEQVRQIAEKLSTEHNLRAILGIEATKKQILVAKPSSLQYNVSAEIKKIGVKGGGNPDIFQGVVDDFNKLDDIAKLMTQIERGL